jgi:hypothetical protein
VHRAELRDQLDAAKVATAKAEESAREAARRAEAELSRNRAEVQQSIIHSTPKGKKFTHRCAALAHTVLFFGYRLRDVLQFLSDFNPCQVARLREQLVSTEEGSDVAKAREMEATVQSALLKTKSLETQVQTSPNIHEPEAHQKKVVLNLTGPRRLPICFFSWI